jgi:hypothetical protein
VKYDPIEKYYKVEYRDGDTEEMTSDEVNCKKPQRYSKREKKAMLQQPIPHSLPYHIVC